ncbi:VOC family protein [Kiloniella majae]|uniref:VOC family protein n=1 Tax=Kiloniella majae TaxID=1938558 RepID=UPI000A2787D3|nr:VOC family protein [Kiloniella majae]
MISHVFVAVTDFDKAFKFYNAVLECLGLRVKFIEPERPWAGWERAGHARPLFLIGEPENGQLANPGNGQMIALLASDRRHVDQAYKTALEQGGTCEGHPGLRQHYHPDYYGAYFRDLDGNKIAVACHNAVEVAK